MEYKSFATDDPEVSRLLKGNFAPGKTAIYVKPLSPAYSEDRLTFKIVDTSSIAKPWSIVSLVRMYRPHLLLFTLWPVAVLMLRYYFMRAQVYWADGVWTVFALMGLHGGVYYLNDYLGHVRGGDALNESSSFRVLARGHLPAHWALKGSIAFFVVAFLCAYPVVMNSSVQVLYGALMAGVCILGYAAWGKGLKSVGLGELAVFLCMGPILTHSASMVLVGKSSLDVVIYGCINGFIAVLYVQHRNFQTMLSDSGFGVKTFMSRLGFDRGRHFLAASFALNLSFIWVFNYMLLPEYESVKLYTSIFIALIYLGIAFWYFKKIKRTQSPVSSELPYLGKAVLAQSFIIHFSYILISFVQYGFMRRIPFSWKLEILSTWAKFTKLLGL